LQGLLCLFRLLMKDVCLPCKAFVCAGDEFPHCFLKVDPELLQLVQSFLALVFQHDLHFRQLGLQVDPQTALLCDVFFQL